jgi:N-methylhydantoinase A/oxoprolinase/acetone carboxylase beta subunit
MRIGVDVGGTNTDAAVLDGALVVARAKSPTTADVVGGVAAALRAVCDRIDPAAVEAVNIGTTQFVNAVVERRRLAPVVAIRLATPPQTLMPMIDWPTDLRELLGGHAYVCAGGHQYDGSPMQPLDVEALRAIARDAAAAGRTQYAVSSTFSPVNAAGESAARDVILAEHPQASVTLSHEIGRIGILERENAAILNAALRPLADVVVDGFVAALAEVGLAVPLHLSQNDGTIMTVERARAFPMLTFASGPTNSMRGAAFETAESDCVVVDVGGTTSDIGLLRGGFPRESAVAVDLAGVRTNFRIPDVVSLGIGGGSIVRGTGGDVTVGPDSVGHRLTQRALVFGGDTLTLTDVAVAAGLADIGDPTRVADLDLDLVRCVVEQVCRRIARAVDETKLQAGDIPVVVVGGGAFVAGDDLPGASTLIRPEHAAVANAVGAASANVSGEVDQIYSLTGRSRDDVLVEARSKAVDRAVRAGADPASIRIVDEEDVPLAYLDDGAALRVRIRAVGDLPTATRNDDQLAGTRRNG